MPFKCTTIRCKFWLTRKLEYSSCGRTHKLKIPFDSPGWPKLNHQRLVATSLVRCTQLYMGWPLDIYNLDVHPERILLRTDCGNLRINRLFHSIIGCTNYLKRSFPLRVLCSWTAFPVNSDQQFLQVNLKVKCVIIIFQWDGILEKKL